MWIGGRWWPVASGSTQGLILSGARSGLCSELCYSTECYRVTFRARGQTEAMSRNIITNLADTQRFKHSPWHLKNHLRRGPQVLTSKVNNTDTFIISWHSHPKPIFPLSHHLPNPTTQNSQRSTRENYNSQNALAPWRAPVRTDAVSSFARSFVIGFFQGVTATGGP